MAEIKTRRSWFLRRHRERAVRIKVKSETFRARAKELDAKTIDDRLSLLELKVNLAESTSDNIGQLRRFLGTIITQCDRLYPEVSVMKRADFAGRLLTVRRQTNILIAQLPEP